MGQDPYGGGGDFTPYQPGDAPGGEPSEETAGQAAETPFVPYGNAAPAPAWPATGTPPPKANRVWPWIIAAAVIVAVIASCFGGIVSIFNTGSDSDSGSDGLHANNLRPGQCLVGTGLERGDEAVGALKEVACDVPHDAEVVAVNPLDEEEAASYDFDSDTAPLDSCEPYFSARAKKLLEREDLYLLALTETATPSAGDQVACLLINYDGTPLEGPVIDLVPESIMPSPTI
ncbi:hypothetical protein F0U44_09310 [Nocardioides humilatus]|uniref:Septum formation-related domain-containing protein n=1 Tax=Nocardioides humilatus TaxID=2607660 RepID=A0A5B1LEE5_9ACTN|nr:hypothetical protein [Nocardioides humilatus]KAA1418684.1 hypothetical protein F0U44_09310 [Nocardioides humilatus]